MSWAIGQRVRKLQPDGIAEGLGTSPGNTIRFRKREGRASGAAERSAWV
jgi:hypothetical protein